MRTAENQIVIVGAGIGGLVAAIALRNAGLQVLVLERVPELKLVGSGITLQTNSMQALARIDMADTVKKHGAELTYVSFCLDTGRQLLAADMARFAGEFGQPTVCIHRGLLQQLLLNELGRENVQTGVCLTEIQQDEQLVRLANAEGTQWTADAVIGADGIRSFVRSQLWDDIKLRKAPYTTWRGTCRNDGLVDDGQAIETWGNGKRFGFMPMDAETVYWFAAQTVASDKGRIDSSPAAMASRFGNWHGPIGEIVRRTASAAFIQTDVYELPRLKAWGRGRITLLGDAAHAMTPNLGQGGGMAIEDAVVLADVYNDSKGVEAWFREFANRRKRRTRAIASVSRRLGMLAQGDRRVTRFLRNLLISHMPKAIHDAHMRKLLCFAEKGRLQSGQRIERGPFVNQQRSF